MCGLLLDYGTAAALASVLVADQALCCVAIAAVVAILVV